MESDKNPFPKIDLFPRFTKVVHFIFDHLQHAGLSDHDTHNTGGGPALDRALYDHYKAAYETYDDGATSPSTYSELFEQQKLDL